MWSVVACLLLGLLAACCCSAAGDEGERLYSNSWAVELVGGDIAADELAARHGFVNLGRVSSTSYYRTHTHTHQSLNRKCRLCCYYWLRFVLLFLPGGEPGGRVPLQARGYSATDTSWCTARLSGGGDDRAVGGAAGGQGSEQEGLRASDRRQMEQPVVPGEWRS